MAIRYVFTLLVQEFFLRRLLIAIIVPFQTTCHTEVVQEKWMLINVLKDAELALVEGKFEARLEV